jgi:DNA-binding NtrC family response regulator
MAGESRRSAQRDPALGESVADQSGTQRVARRASLPSFGVGPSPQRFGVLVVDDDPSLLRSIEAILSLDFDVVACASPVEALRIFQPARFHVVCSDYMMPNMDGHELLREIGRRSHDVCCMLMTARADLSVDGRDFPVMFKPFDPERFLHGVAHLARIAEMKRSTHAMTLATRSEIGTRGRGDP